MENEWYEWNYMEKYGKVDIIHMSEDGIYNYAIKLSIYDYDNDVKESLENFSKF